MRKARISWRKCMIMTLAVLLYLVLLTTYMTAGLYARYTSGASGSDQARVAMFVVDENVQSEVLTHRVELNHLVPGTERRLELNVTNHRENVVSEVDLGYHLELEYTGNLPLDITVTGVKDNGELPVRKPNTGDDIIFQNGKMEAAQKTSHTYTVLVKWPDDQKDVKLSEEIDLIVVTLNSWQID